MPGWNLKNGECIVENMSEDRFWNLINKFFSEKSKKTTSYKYGFFKSILDNLFNISDDMINYEVLFERFSEMYWNLISKYNVTQINMNRCIKGSAVELIIFDVLNKYDLYENIQYESLKDDIKKELISRITNKCSQYVVGAFYMDTDQEFYSFSRKEQKIKFNKDVVKYLIKFKNILSKINYFEWVKFIEKNNYNKSIFDLAEKLDKSTQRGDLSFYREFLFKVYGCKKCFYCGKDLSNKQIQMDHVIPWAFIKDDKQWNLVMACSKCNNNKRDKLPSRYYLNKLIEQNELIKKSKDFNFVKRDYIGYSKEKLLKIYESAIFNGFDKLWENNV